MFHKKVIVVYPKNYKDVAIVLQHAISKVKNFDCVVWSIDHYDQNLPTLSASSNVLFLGGSEENKFTKIFVSEKSSIVNSNGACFWLDGCKAGIFGEGKLEQEKQLLEIIKDLTSSSKKNSEGTSIAELVAYGLFHEDTFAISAISLPIIGVFSYLSKRKKRNQLRLNQTKVAMYNFVEQEMEKWVNYDEKPA